MEAVSGEWVVMLDSDDEPLPEALSRMSRIARGKEAGVERLGLMYRRDDGGVTPLSALRDEALDYAGYLRWLEGRSFFDFLNCTRRFTYDHVRWQEWDLLATCSKMDFPNETADAVART